MLLLCLLNFNFTRQISDVFRKFSVACSYFALACKICTVRLREAPHQVLVCGARSWPTFCEKRSAENYFAGKMLNS